IVTPYLEADLSQLHFETVGDTMWITHVDYKPRKLTRTSVITFSLDVITFTTGPFLTRNDILKGDDVTMTYAGSLTKGSVGTLTSSSAHFLSDHVGSIMELTHSRSLADSGVSTTGTSDSSFLDIKGSWGHDTEGRWKGTTRIIRNENGLGDETFRKFVAATVGARNIQLKATENKDNVQYKIVTEAGMSADFSANITANASTKVGVARIDSITSTTVAAVTLLTPLDSTNGTGATKRWAEGAWSGVQGYPKSITFFNDHAVYAGRRFGWLSAVGDFENFDAGINDADSFTIILPTAEEIMWVDTVDKVIVFGTTGTPWTLQSNKVGTVMTPSNFTIDEQAGFGSADIQGIKINNAIIFVDFVQKKLMEFAFNASQDKYLTPELTVLAEHFSNSSTVTWLSHQKNPESIIWFGMADGTAHSFTYQRDQDVLAYASHPTTGTVNSGSIIPSAGEDEVWFSTDRNLNSLSVTCIERMTVRTITDDDDVHKVDCGVIYDDVSATVISGGDHLEGETVAILADGVVVAPQTVTGGAITLTTAASVVHVGLPFTPQVKPMRLDIESAAGSSHGSIAQIPELVLSLLNSKNVAFGDSIDDIVGVVLDDPELVNNTEITDLFTGDVTVHRDGGFSIEDSIVVTNSKTNGVTDPTSLTVRAIVARKDVTGR
ncbi:hypothetical protein LCGC14_2038440, partial [marine sediment metagenome]